MPGSAECHSNLCKPPLNKCNPGFQLSVNIEEGDCCATYSCVPKDVCVVNAAEYSLFSPVPASNGSCQQCVCSAKKDPATLLNVPTCQPVRCNTGCQPGNMLVKMDGECCGTCVQTSCVIRKAGGTLQVQQPGTIWQDPGLNCTSYRCEKVGTTFTVVKEKTICAPFVPDICQQGTVKMTPDGCCQTCEVNVLQSCALLTMSVKVTYSSCSSLVEIGYCTGPCMSSSTYVPDTQQMAYRCSCCKEVEMVSKQIRLSCPYGRYINYSLNVVARCSCVTSDCTP
ncbi:intestinal mucin-like protein [Ambystoma mexicanum]|uniref:intestinal mucin-like protein n=1 Tax=Ambystoma mexicanum TaxID=8296 RepID=UPI0037E82C63